MKHPLVIIMLVLSLTAAGAAHARQDSSVTPSDVELDVSNPAGSQPCAENSQTMSACRSFIKGFIQGALLTDTAIIQSFENTEPSYLERAMRTRLGNRGSRAPTALAGFCLPAERTILELAEETLDHVKDAQRNSSELAKRVYESLKVDYPCE